MSNKKHFIYIQLVCLMPFLLFCCAKHPGPQQPSGFLPGESLVDGELIKGSFNGNDGVINFEFSLHFDVDYLNIWDDGIYCVAPKKTIWDQFESNKEDVYDEYFSVTKRLIDFEYVDKNRRTERYTSVYATGEYSITSNKEIAGIGAGEDLSELFKIRSLMATWKIEGSELSKSKYQSGTLQAFFSPGTCLPTAFMLSYLPSNPVWEKGTEIYISIPVKTGLYLNWINDKITSPNADMQYRDITLCYTIHMDDLDFIRK